MKDLFRRTCMSGVILILLIGATGCNIFETDQNSNILLRLGSVTGLTQDEINQGTVEEDYGTSIIYSDVIYDPDGLTSGSYTTDYAKAELKMEFVNPDLSEEDYATYNTELIIYRVDVEFSRPDGNNVVLETIPEPFSTSVHVRLGYEIELWMAFPVVRPFEKKAEPLCDLVHEGEIQLTCRCTIYARDSLGNEVLPQSGEITIMFANYANVADEDTGG